MEIIQKRFYRKNYPLPKNKQAAPMASLGVCGNSSYSSYSGYRGIVAIGAIVI